MPVDHHSAVAGHRVVAKVAVLLVREVESHYTWVKSRWYLARFVSC
jgi:hypothetical protein